MIEMISSFLSIFILGSSLSMKDLVTSSEITGLFPSPVLHFNLSIHLKKCKVAKSGRGTIIINGHHFAMTEKCYFEQHQTRENYVLPNRKGLPHLQYARVLSSFLMRGAQLTNSMSKNAFSKCSPTESQDDYTPDTVTQTGAVRKLTLEL